MIAFASSITLLLALTQASALNEVRPAKGGADSVGRSPYSIEFAALIAAGSPLSDGGLIVIDAGAPAAVVANDTYSLAITSVAPLAELTTGNGDANSDGVVDALDLARCLSCLTGPNVPPPGAGCWRDDLNRDFDVDLADFGEFQVRFGH